MHIHQWINYPPIQKLIRLNRRQYRRIRNIQPQKKKTKKTKQKLQIFERLPGYYNILRAKLNAILIAIKTTQTTQTTRTPVVMVIRGFVFQPLFRIVFINGSYFVCFRVRVCLGTCHGSMWIQWIVVCVCVKVVKVLGCGLGCPVCRGCMVLVWLGIGNLFMRMYIPWALVGQFVLGSCYWGCLHLLVCSIGCVCWLVMFEVRCLWWGVLPYCGELFLGLSDKGLRTLIVNGAMYLCHFCDIVVRGAIHEQSIEKLANLKIPKTSIETLMKNIHQNAIKYLTYLVLNKRKLDNKQSTVAPPWKGTVPFY